MKLLEALNYVNHHHESLKIDKKCVIGVAHTPNDPDATFYIVELAFHPAVEATKSELASESYYKVLMEGGIPLRGEFVEDFYSEKTALALGRVLPAFAREIEYQVCTLSNYHFDGMIEDGLHTIFPNLPSLLNIERDDAGEADSPTLYSSITGDAIADFNLDDYNSYAVKLINKANGQYEPPTEPPRELFYL